MIYTALALAANAASPEVLRDLRSGDMRALVIHDTPRDVPAAELLDGDDAVHRLEDWRGRWLVVNFWATWCPPCRAEMPGLDRLEAALGGPGFAVLPVATGRNPMPAVRRFYQEAGLAHLPILRDPRQGFAAAMGVFGLPVTVILDPDGREVARLTGDAHWDGPEARAILDALLAQEDTDNLNER
ncbi:TlpA family protein disulfide reductase [Rhodobaculum claviforme]|nr:TlpA disulfide reductase family protein [Rhodobaculum claviforme]